MLAASLSDRPCFKVKENPELETAGVYLRLAVERYGGMLMAPWLDRPLLWPGGSWWRRRRASSPAWWTWTGTCA